MSRSLGPKALRKCGYLARALTQSFLTFWRLVVSP